MKSLRNCILFLLFILPIIKVIGQDLTNSVWNFGQNCRLDFSSGAAVASTSAISTVEGCASICDESGNLLFYTDGVHIFRSDNTIIPGSENTLGGSTSSSQSALIVPFPGNPGKYYIFTTAGQLFGGVSGQYEGTTYAIFDINANSGQGGLIQPITELLAVSAELLTGIGSCTTDEYWIVAHSWPGSDFYAWRLDETGLSPPVISTIGPELSEVLDVIGNIRASYDGTKLAWTRTHYFPSSISLYDFDFISGLITNEYIKEFPSKRLYGLCFSPDNSKLYVAGSNPSGPSLVLQYNALATSEDEFSQSEVIIANPKKEFGAIENAPDGKMYIAHYFESSLSVIQSPNEQGLNCSFQLDALTLATGSICRYGLQNKVLSPFISINSPLFPQDTVIACYKPYSLSIGNSSGNQINATYDINKLNFLWNTGETTSSIFVEDNGTYYLTSSNEYCQNSDTIEIAFVLIPEFDLGNDSVYCNLDSLILDPEINGKTYLWSDGSNDSTLLITESGLYWLEVSDSTCFASDSVNIIIYGKDPVVEIPNVFTPNQDGINDFFEAGSLQLEDYSIIIYNRWGTKIFSSNNPTDYWDGKFENQDSPEGTYFWKCTYYDFCLQKIMEQKGSVTLLR